MRRFLLSGAFAAISTGAYALPPQQQAYQLPRVNLNAQPGYNIGVVASWIDETDTTIPGGTTHPVSQSEPLPVTMVGGGGAGSGNAAAGSTGANVPASANYDGFSNSSGKLTGVSTVTPLPTSDTNNASYGAVSPPGVVTVGNTYAVARSIQLNCTTGGTITFTENGVGVQWIVGVGTTEIPHATTAVTSLGAAVCPQIYAHY